MTHPLYLDVPRVRPTNENNRPPQDFQTAADGERPGGVTIHRIKNGEKVVELGEQYGYTLEQLQQMNPDLRDDPTVIEEGDTLTILDESLFNSVEQAVTTAGEAVTAQESYEEMTTNQGDVPEHLRELNRIEAPNVLQTANEKRDEAVTLLTTGFLEAGLPVALDEQALTEALDAHAEAIAPMGDDQPGFEEFVEAAKTEARAQLDDIFGREVTFTDAETGEESTGALRDLVAQAEGTPTASRTHDASPEWRNVQAAMVSLMDDLAQESVEANGGDEANAELIKTQTVQNLAQILGAASPNEGFTADQDPFVSVVNTAANEILVMRSLNAVNHAADPDVGLDSPHAVPEIVALLEQTEGVGGDLAIERTQGSQSVIDQAVRDLFRNQLVYGMGALPQDQARVDEAMLNLTILADRMQGENGDAAVEDLAGSIARTIRDTGEESRDSSETLAIQIGASLREAIADGHSPALAIEVARQLMDPEVMGESGLYETEASDIMNSVGMGVEQLNENAASTGTELYENVIYISELGRQNFENSSNFSHEDGVNALVEENEDLIEKADRYGEAVVLTLAATENLPSELADLEGTERLEGSRSDLENAVDREIVGEGGDLNEVALVTQTSSSAAVHVQRFANEAMQDQLVDLMADLPEEDLDALIENLGELPADDPLAELATQLQTLEDPKTVLYENPALTYALFDHFSENATSGGEEVPAAPNAGFISRTGRDVLLQVFDFQTQNGGGLIPGVSPIQPRPGTQLDAAIMDMMRQPTRTSYSGLAATAQQLWLQANPVRPLEARGGVPVHTPAIPFVNAGSALLNLWGTATLSQSDVLMDQAWGVYFGVGATRDLALAVDGVRAWTTGMPGFSQIRNIRGWEWLPRVYNGAGVALSVLQVGYELYRGDPVMAAAWVPGAAASIYAAFPGAVAAGPVATIGFLVTAGLVTGISQYRRVEESNRFEEPLGVYLNGAAPDVDKPESLANCDENAIPYLAFNPVLAEAQGVTPEEMVDYLYSLDPDERDTFIDRALQVKPNDDGEYPPGDPDDQREPGGIIMNPHGNYPATIDTRITRSQIETIQDFQLWAVEHGYELPTGTA